MQEWSDGVRIAIDVFVACVIISALLLCINLGKSIMRVMDVQQAAAADVQAYRVAAAYEGTDVYPQDIVNLVLTNRGFPAVQVTYKSGVVYRWDKNNAATQYTSAAIGAVVKKDVMYICTLVHEDPDNDLSDVYEYQFTEK